MSDQVPVVIICITVSRMSTYTYICFSDLLICVFCRDPLNDSGTLNNFYLALVGFKIQQWLLICASRSGHTCTYICSLTLTSMPELGWPVSVSMHLFCTFDCFVLTGRNDCTPTLNLEFIQTYNTVYELS